MTATLLTVPDQSDVYVGESRPEIIVPRTERLGDYASVVATLIDTFAGVTGQDELSVYRSLATAGAGRGPRPRRGERRSVQRDVERRRGPHRRCPRSLAVGGVFTSRAAAGLPGRSEPRSGGSAEADASWTDGSGQLRGDVADADRAAADSGVVSGPGCSEPADRTPDDVAAGRGRHRGAFRPSAPGSHAAWRSSNTPSRPGRHRFPSGSSLTT